MKNFAKDDGMFTSDCFGINDDGNLTIGGCDTVKLAKKYGTPLYIMDESKIRESCRKYKEAFEKYYDGMGKVIYASKALNCKEICKIIAQEGLGIDVVSGGELYTALKSGFPAKNIHFHGNNKTLDELKMSLENNVGRIVVDNLYELENINKLAEKMKKKVSISMRIKPGVDAHTHDFIKTGQIDSKFGFALENDEAINAVKTACYYDNIELEELHCHIGSQIFEIEPFLLATEVMLDFMAKIKKELNLEIKYLNLGGGFGIKYTCKDNTIDYEDYIREISKFVKNKIEKNGLKRPVLCIEPGRSIVGEAGITLYTVGSIKDIPNVRTYVSVDGGMCDNPRYALYGADYYAVIANKALKSADKLVTIAGKCCESGDLIQENINIQNPQEGDILAVLSTGAYNYSMSSNYNRIPRPPILMVKDGVERVIVKRETYDDIIKNDI